jgi:hypothetical protein
MILVLANIFVFTPIALACITNVRLSLCVYSIHRRTLVMYVCVSRVCLYMCTKYVSSYYHVSVYDMCFAWSYI